MTDLDTLRRTEAEARNVVLRRLSEGCTTTESGSVCSACPAEVDDLRAAVEARVVAELAQEPEAETLEKAITAVRDGGWGGAVAGNEASEQASRAAIRMLLSYAAPLLRAPLVATLAQVTAERDEARATKDMHKERQQREISLRLAANARVTRLEQALERLGSMEAFCMPRAVTKSDADEELIARIAFARKSLAEVPRE